MKTNSVVDNSNIKEYFLYSVLYLNGVMFQDVFIKKTCNSIEVFDENSIYISCVPKDYINFIQYINY